MNITKKMLKGEIKTLQKASKLHAEYSIGQYKQVLKTLDELEKEKAILEQKVKQRTKHLEVEIEEKQNLAKELEKVAKYDQLTGLPNRYLFINELKLVKDEADLRDEKFVLMFIDLDGFKFINDTYGHKIGDKLLQTVASRIKQELRKEDMVARLGGDEFTIILKNIENEEKIAQIALKVINSISKTIKINDLKVYVGASIGIYIYEVNDKFENVVSKADIAMYEAKKAGKGRYIFFSDEMKKDLQTHTTIKHKIKTALKNEEFINYFQPIVSSIDYNIRGAEILLRWYDGEKIVPPIEFIEILEDDVELIKEVTFWQIDEVIKLIKNFDIYFSINISAKLLASDELLQKLYDVTSKIEFDTSKIFFELTETSLSVNLKKASEILYKIKEMGFNLSLDDFGTGYSSLAYLRELPFDTIKIDKKFIDNLKFSKKDKKLLFSIINMAKILDMKIILEGIEEKHQFKEIEKKEYIKFQGFYFYKPLEYESLVLELKDEQICV